jgi:hypothetical protein
MSIKRERWDRASSSSVGRAKTATHPAGEMRFRWKPVTLQWLKIPADGFHSANDSQYHATVGFDIRRCGMRYGATGNPGTPKVGSLDFLQR